MAPERRRSRRRRPSLDDLLRTHTAELELGAAPVDDEGIAPVEVAGLQALFDLVGSGAAYLTLTPVAALLDTLGVFMAGDKVADLFQVHKLQLSPADAEEREESGAKPPGDVLDLAGFAKLLEMVISSGDVADCLGGLGDTRQPLHKLGEKEVAKLRKIFNAVDIDNDKELTHRELLVVFQRWGLEVLESEATALIGRFDVNNSGTLDFDEFLGLAAAAISLRDGDDEAMETTIQTHFQREHAKVKSIATRSKLAVDAATLAFFKRGDAAANTIAQAESVAADALHKLGGDGAAAKKARDHVKQRLIGELDERLLEAAENGKVDEIERCLARGADANAARLDPPRETALLLALASRHDRAATRLLDAGADAGVTDDRGRGPALEAAKSGVLSKNKHILQLLVSRGADVSAKDELGQAALLAAVQRNKVVEVDALLAFGADANAADAEGSTPLMKAAQNGARDVVARLLDANPDVNALDDRNLTATDRASLTNCEAVAELLARHGGLAGEKILATLTPRERDRRVSRGQRAKRNSRTGRIRTLSDSQLDRAHRASFSRDRGTSNPMPEDAAAAIEDAVKMFSSPSPRLDPIVAPS